MCFGPGCPRARVAAPDPAGGVRRARRERRALVRQRDERPGSPGGGWRAAAPPPDYGQEAWWHPRRRRCQPGRAGRRGGGVHRQAVELGEPRRREQQELEVAEEEGRWHRGLYRRRAVRWSDREHAGRPGLLRAQAHQDAGAGECAFVYVADRRVILVHERSHFPVPALRAAAHAVHGGVGLPLFPDPNNSGLRRHHPRQAARPAIHRRIRASRPPLDCGHDPRAAGGV
mmetsp:Transcript_97732/g.254719  ORF Transcript_97732/g.254719 Transcript_97732/m.254719 type:complete len:229 (+) Transcript_97732:209-895(+)